MAPRASEQRGAVSRPFPATCSAIQGLRSGTRLAKDMAHFAMLQVYRKHSHIPKRICMRDSYQSLA
eukprot:266126-Pyramimonas_sp.AAC.1